jgi:hypothetical protein
MSIKHVHQVHARTHAETALPKEVQERIDAAKKALSEGVKKLNQMKKDKASPSRLLEQQEAVSKLRLRLKKAQRGQQ